MKILLNTTTFKNITNGPTKFAHFLYRNGDGKNGLELHILTEDVLEEGIRLYRCRIGIVKKLLPFAPLYRMIKYYFRSLQLSKIVPFDYVIYNNAIYGILHAYFKPNVVGMINDYNNQKIISRSSIFNYTYIKRTIFKYLEKKAIIHSHLILVNSDFLMKELRKLYPEYSSKIVRLYKGIEILDKVEKNNYNWNVTSMQEVKILFVKNDFITGGLKILAESLASINLQFNITIVGPDFQYRDQIGAYFKTSNVKLNLLGRQSQDQVFHHMATHHIFCVPSLQEALGVANLEALNIGIPVVSSDAGGIPEVLDYGNCGFLSITGDAGSLAFSLRNCLYDNENRKQKVLNGFEHIRKFKADFILENLQMILNGSV